VGEIVEPEWTRADHDARTDRLRPLADHLRIGHDVPEDERRYRDTWLHIALLAEEWFADHPPAVPDPTVEARIDRLADWLGEMPESHNVFDMTDEATTVISIDVEALAQRIAVEIHNSVAAARAAAPDALRAARIEALVDAHHLTTPVQCVCGWRETDPGAGTYGGHIAALLEDPALGGRP
jgi:hypothetical protein